MTVTEMDLHRLDSEAPQQESGEPAVKAGKNVLWRFLKQHKLLLTDGATGTLLQTMGLKRGIPPELICLENPEMLRETARRYRAAGSDIIHTNTFGASEIRLEQFGLKSRMEEINRIAVESARKGAGDRIWISASMGPSGRRLPPFGNADPDELQESFFRQARILMDAGTDFISIETMTDLNEALLAVQAVRHADALVPVLVSLTYGNNSGKIQTLTGQTPEDVIQAFLNTDISALGANCGEGLLSMHPICRELRKTIRWPMVIQPSAGLPVKEGKRLKYPETPIRFAAGLLDLVLYGACIIGGCCGTTPNHIRAMRKVVDRMKDRID